MFKGSELRKVKTEKIAFKVLERIIINQESKEATKLHKNNVVCVNIDSSSFSNICVIDL